jgi:hypothetical protein
MSVSNPTSLDLAVAIDPDAKRDAYWDDDQSIWFGRQLNDTNWEGGRAYWDSATTSYRIAVEAGGSGTLRDLFFDVGGNAFVQIVAASPSSLWIRQPGVAADSGINLYNQGGISYIFFWQSAGNRTWFQSTGGNLIWNPGGTNGSFRIGNGSYDIYLETSTVKVAGVVRTVAGRSLSLEGSGKRSILCATSQITGNVDQENLDFRYYTQGSTLTFHIDGALDAVGIGTNLFLASEKLRVAGEALVDGILNTDGGRQKKISRLTANTTIDTTYHIVLGDTDGGAFTITLTASPVDGETFTIKNTGSAGNNLTVGRNGNNIEGVAADWILGDGSSATLIYQSTEGWRVI